MAAVKQASWVTRHVALLKVGVWLVGLTPATVLAVKLFQGTLRPDPVQRLTHVTGLTTLIMLLLTLAISPLRRWTGWSPLIRFRRLIGLFAFGYALLHFTIWALFDHVFDPQAMIEDIAERPYITVGFSALMLLLPLALTSTRGWIRRLGGRRWASLHRLIYVAAALGVLHFLWLVKLDTREPVIYATVLVILLVTRLKPRGAVKGRPGN